ncbi:MAG TPA: SGNH/GDSL hydrolase family protein [Burkholderiaceae bacterium]|nr:SGNH/GDSL hydrolase family protein [Burkholderiaceae bacterium]
MSSASFCRAALSRLATTLALALCAGTAAAQAVPDRLVFFGTSLTDSGNAFTWLSSPAGAGCGVPLNTPPYAFLDDLLVPDGVYAAGGHHVSNGATWAEVLARSMALGVAARPAFANPGTQTRNYAVGGARAVAGYPCRFNLPDQVAAYLGDSPRPTPATWFALEVGANDVRDALVAGLQQGPGAAQAVLTNALTSLTQQLATLHAYGARRMVLLNLPDIGATPAVRAFGPEAQYAAGLLVGAYNQGLAGLRLTTWAALMPDADIRIVDAYGTLQSVLAQPAAFGFSNTTDPCLTPGLPPFRCANASQYVFWDGIHPTTAVHAILARQAEMVISAP